MARFSGGSAVAAACLFLTLARLTAVAMQEVPPPTTIERALTERTCDGLLAARPTDVDAHEACVAEQLVSLRGDFGRDLSRLSAPDRRKLDSLCSPLSRAESRDRYLDCVNAQLAVLHERLHRGRSASPDTAQPSADAAPPRAPALAPLPRPSTFTWIWVTGAVLLIATAAAVAVVVRKRQQPVCACSVCGTPIAEAGALCTACRHEAAEARRRAAADRPADARHDVEPRPAGPVAEDTSRTTDRPKPLALDEGARQRDEVDRRAREEAERQAREAAERQARERAERQAREEAERREREETERQQRERESEEAGEAAEAVFDPYQVLGIRPGADAEAIRAAYEAGKAKYDPEQVSHLSPEVQHHYQAKAAAVERAYLMLTTT